MKTVENACRILTSDAGTTYMVDTEKQATKCLSCGAVANFISESIKQGKCCENRRVADMKNDRNPKQGQ